MDAQGVLTTARSGAAPSTWSVLPLRRDWLQQSVLRWAVVAVLAFAMFVPVLLITIPDNFTKGTGSIVITSLLLLLLASAAFGSAGVAIYDLWRLTRAADFLIVITPDDFVKAAPGKVIHVPMEHIESVTLRGVQAPVQESFADLQALAQTSPLTRFMRSPRPRQPKQQPSLAFLDTRTNAEVLVARDEAHGDLFSLSRLLEINSDAKRRSRTR